MSLIILSLTSSVISFWGDGKSIFSIKKKAKTNKKRKKLPIKLKIYLSLIILSVTSSLISFWGDGKLIFSIKKKAKNINKIATINFTNILIKDTPGLDLCNLGCIVYKIYLNSRIKTNLW